MTKFSAKAWFLAGTTAPTFKLLDLRDLELVIAGKGVTLGSVVGIAEYELAADNLPQHSHTYDQPGVDVPENVNVIGSILGGVQGLTLARPKVTSGVSPARQASRPLPSRRSRSRPSRSASTSSSSRAFRRCNLSEVGVPDQGKVASCTSHQTGKKANVMATIQAEANLMKYWRRNRTSFHS